MSIHEIIGIAGFLLAALSVIWNDVIQTLGTFISSNEKLSWKVLWLFAAFILSFVLVFGWVINGGDVSYGRLSSIPYESNLSVIYLLPPLILLLITRWGIPVSTSFMILTVFSAGQIIEKMVLKSVFGYVIAFIVSLILYLVIARKLETQDSIKRVEDPKKRRFWTVAQWLSTGFLWSQWLIQDFANIYVYLPRNIDITYLVISLILLLGLLAMVFRIQGGKIQNVVKKKVNTGNIRSATIIDLCYGLVLYFFTQINTVPMSTTWTFIGILAGREIGITLMTRNQKAKRAYNQVFLDLGKVFFGLLASIILAFGIIYLKGH